jgi:hypothetical protein
MFENMPGGGNGAAAPLVVNPGHAQAADGGVHPGANAVAPVAGPAAGGDDPDAVSIAGISALKGLILYGATLTLPRSMRISSSGSSERSRVTRPSSTASWCRRPRRWREFWDRRSRWRSGRRRCVALTYILNQTETPATIKALAVAFAGYVIALVDSAYNLSKHSDA